MKNNLGQMDALPESDCAKGAVHPRLASELISHSHAQDLFLDAYHSQRLHHAWLIHGPKGIGKATLAWKIAKFLLHKPILPNGNTAHFEADQKIATTLDIDPHSPLSRRVAQLSEPRLCLIRRTWDQKKNKFSAGISVEEIRKLNSFFQMSAPEGGRRVVIIDAADDMTMSAANALLKTLEEPPKHAVILLISHQPARLLPTIRSRCRTLKLQPLNAQELEKALEANTTVEGSPALYELSKGSIGDSLRYANSDAVDIYTQIAGVMNADRKLNRPAALKIAESCAGAAQQEHLGIVIELILLFISRLAQTGIGRAPTTPISSSELDLLFALSPHQYAAQDWAQLAQMISEKSEHARAVNLDPSALILDIFLMIEKAAQKMRLYD